jgi:23S rRNA (cytidine2498-2'-O)-methyltransferase
MAASPRPDPRWLLRLPEVFADLAPAVLERAGATSPLKLSGGWYAVHLPVPEPGSAEDAALFIAWRMPVEHSWPCCPEKTESFIEKAAQALAKKFVPRGPQAVLAGPLDAGGQNRYYKSLASNLRGRLLQLFPKLPAATAEEQDPRRPSLFVLAGKEGLFAGMTTPREANGFHPGGVKFIRQSEGMISRAGAKIAEALHWLRLHREPPAVGSHWLELGASPGGMTGELLQRGYAVTAVDRAPLDARLRGAAGLRFLHDDAGTVRLPPSARFAALLCDLNGPALESMRAVTRLTRNLWQGGLVVFTLKTGGAESVVEIPALARAVEAEAGAAGLALIGRTHLNYNRHEFTLCFERREDA